MAGKSGRIVVSWLFVLIGVLILIIAINNSLKSRKSDKNQTKEKTEGVSDGNTSTYKYRTINYSGEYGEVIYLESEVMAAFLQATTSYCCVNKDGVSVCGEKGQDVSTQMGDSFANTELRFKSKNGENGTLKIRIRAKTSKELNK